MNIFTRDCIREDCRLQADGPGSQTLLGWIPTFDKHGNLIGRGDPNIMTCYMHCVTCGARWTESTQYGVTTYHYR
jgi:hypothetical protein